MECYGDENQFALNSEQNNSKLIFISSLSSADVAKINNTIKT